MAQYGAVASSSKNIWNFDPTTIGGCVLWLDASDSNTLFSNTAGTTLATNSGSVLRWNDKSISANHAFSTGYTTTSVVSGTPNFPTSTATTITYRVTLGNTFGLGVLIGNLVTTTGITPSTFNVTNAPISSISVVTAQSVYDITISSTSVGSIQTATSGGSMFFTNVNYPTLSSNSLSFSGTQYIVNQSPSLLPTGSSNTTRFIVSRTNDITNRQTLHTQGSNAGGAGHNIHYNVGPGAAATAPSIAYFLTNAFPIPNQNTSSIQNISITTGVHNNLIQSTWFNGSPVSLNNNGDIQKLLPGNVNVGSAYSIFGGDVVVPNSPFTTQARGLNGNIYEVLVFNSTLSNTDRQIVEGYLAWKWGIQASLPTTHPYYYAPRPFSRYFNPTDIEGCHVWIDTADRSTITLTGSNVTTIADKSGQGNNFTNASSTLTYTQTLNGLPVVTSPVGGASNSLSSPSITRDPYNHTYFYVIKYPATGTTPIQLLRGTGQFFGHTGTTFPYLENNNTDIFGSNTSYWFYTTGFPFASADAFYGNRTFVNCCVRQNGIFTITSNGVTASTSTNANGTALSTLFRNTSPCVYQITPGTINAQFAELIIYDTALTTYQRQMVEGYLCWKWGLRTGGATSPANYGLPTTHPFYKFPPPSLTPIQPELQLYKKIFDPADINPSLWLDMTDTTLYTSLNNRITSITSKGIQPVTLNAPTLSFIIEIPSSTTIPIGGTGTTFTLNRAPFGIGIFSGITVTIGGVAISNCTLTGGSLTLTTSSPVTISNGAVVTSATYTLGLQANTTIPTGGTGTSFTMNNTATGTGTGAVSNIPLLISGVYVPNCSITNGSTTLTTPSLTIANGADVVIQGGPLVSTSSRGSGYGLPYMDFSSGGNIRLTSASTLAYNSSLITITATRVDFDGSSIIISSSPASTLRVNQPIVFNGSGTVIAGTTNITAGTTYFIRSVSTLAASNTNFPTNYITLSTSSGGAVITGLNVGTLSGVTANAGAYLFTFTSSIPHNIPNGSPITIVVDSMTISSASVSGTFFGNVQSVPSSTTFTFLITSNLTSISAGTATILVAHVQFGNNPIINGNLSSDLTTLTLTTAMPHNLQTGYVIQPYFFGPSLPSQWNQYTSANVRSSNPSNTTFVGSISGTTLTITSGTPPGIGAVLSGTGVTAGTYVSGVITSGSSYIVNTSQSVSAGTTFTSTYSVITFTGSISGTTLTYTSGTIPSVGMLLSGTNVTSGTYIVSGTSPTFVVNTSQTTSSTTITGSNYSIELTFPSTKWPMLPSGLNNGLSLSINSTSGNTFTFSTNVALFAGGPGSLIVFTSAVGSVPAGAYYIASVSGSTATLSASRTLTPLLSPGTTSGLNVRVWQYANISLYRLCSAGTSSINGFNNVNTSIIGIDYTNRVVSIGSTTAAPTSGAVNMSLVTNPAIQNSGSGSFAQLYSFGMSHANVLNSTQFTIPIPNNFNAPYSLSAAASQSYGGIDYIGDMANYGYTDFRFGGNVVGGYSITGFSGTTSTQAVLSYPANGYILEGTTNISNIFNTTTTTIVYIQHSANPTLRTSGQAAFGNCCIATTLTSGGVSGRDTTSGGRDFSIRPFGTSQGTQHTLRHNNVETTFRPTNLLDSTSGFRINTIVFNGNSTAVGDVPANTKNLSYTAWRFDSVNGTFAYRSGGDFFALSNTSITNGTTLQPTILRLGCDTSVTNFGYDPMTYFDGGISELMIFNTPLTLEQRQLVEGYLTQKYATNYFLAAGVGNVNAANFIHPYRLNPVMISPSMTLTNIHTQGLTAWFDATNSSTIGFASGISINSWSISGGNVSLTLVPNSTNYPTLVQNAQNGLPGVRFSASGTPLGTSFIYPITNFSTINSNNEFTIINVYKQPTFTSNQVISNIIGSANNPRLAAFTNTFSYRNTTTEQTKNYTANVNNQTYISVYYRRGNTLFVRDNGTQDTGPTSSGTNLTIPNSIGSIFGVTLGAYAVSSPTTNAFDGDIYEHIIFRYAITDQAIYQIEGYLAWKWGIQNSLPTTHPYYRVRP